MPSDDLTHFSQRIFSQHKAGNLQEDSRLVERGDLLLAYANDPSARRRHIAQAIAQGASAIIYDPQGLNLGSNEASTCYPLANLKAQASFIAGEFFGHPSRGLEVIAVTGTNGKTSTCYFIAQALTQLKKACAIIGTSGCGFVDQITAGNMTTPTAVDCQRLLHRFKQQGAQAVAMEVSSHALDQHRVAALHFSTAILTNITRDHLDYHGSMANYAACKKTLFHWPALKFAIFNADDDYGQQWLQDPSISACKLAYSQQAKLPKTLANLTQATAIVQSLAGSHARIEQADTCGELRIPLIGSFNLSNSLAALAYLQQHASLANNLAIAKTLTPPPGRMQRFGNAQSASIFVDYAHTPDALQNVLATLKALTKKHLFCVIGCGGDRDQGKRPQMAAIAEQYCAHSFFTNDNPRFEAPQQIFADMMAGVKNKQAISIIADRAVAIATAMQQAKPGDCLLIAGKGEESYQIFGDEKMPFSDAACVLAALNANPD